MDPCPYERIIIGNLGLKGVTSSSYCKIKVKNHPTQYVQITSFSGGDENQQVEPQAPQVQACFNMKRTEFERCPGLKIEVYSGRVGSSPGCGFGSGMGMGKGKLLGVVNVGLDSEVVQNGWVGIGDLRKENKVELHLSIRVERDPRFVFEFDGEPECSPQVFQVNRNVRQAVFTCKFSLRNTRGEHNLRSDSSLLETNSSKKWLRSMKSDKEKPSKERKGWSITVHDLSGSPVAMASMVTPFVPSHGTDSVSHSNPGAWLILRPGHSTWKPWGRLEAWRESKNKESLGYRFELLPDASTSGLEPVTLSTSTISSKTGGKFEIDMSNGNSPMSTPNGSFGSGSGSGSDFEFGSWAHLMYQGFVMSSSVGGVGSKPEVEVGVQHVTCTEDAAAFVALAAAIDLSVDACQPFSRKLRKELRQDGEH